MIFKAVLEFFDINIENIDVMYISIPNSLINKDLILSSHSYFHKDFENIFNLHINKELPLLIDFLMCGDDEYISNSLDENEYYDVYILYNDDGVPCIESSTVNLFMDEKNLSLYNQYLIEKYKLMKII